MKQISPSKVTKFTDCAASFKYRYIDKLPDISGTAATTGTLVHSALETFYQMPAPLRTLSLALYHLDTAYALYEPRSEDEGPPDSTKAELAVQALFDLEDPMSVDVHSTEMDLLIPSPEGFDLRGIIDRIDRTPDGLVVVDYKTGKPPTGDKIVWAKSVGVRFYADLVSRYTGEVPKAVVLLFLGGTPERLTFPVTPGTAVGAHKKTVAVWEAIERSEESGVWQPKTSQLCSWCSYKDACPAGQDYLAKRVDKRKPRA